MGLLSLCGVSRRNEGIPSRYIEQIIANIYCGFFRRVAYNSIMDYYHVVRNTPMEISFNFTGRYYLKKN